MDKAKRHRKCWQNLVNNWIGKKCQEMCRILLFYPTCGLIFLPQSVSLLPFMDVDKRHSWVWNKGPYDHTAKWWTHHHIFHKVPLTPVHTGMKWWVQIDALYMVGFHHSWKTQHQEPNSFWAKKIFWWLSGKEWACKEGDLQETGVRSLGWEDALEKKMATHSRILAWEIHGEEPGRRQSMGSQTQTWLSK